MKGRGERGVRGVAEGDGNSDVTVRDKGSGDEGGGKLKDWC